MTCERNADTIGRINQPCLYARVILIVMYYWTKWFHLLLKEILVFSNTYICTYIKWISLNTQYSLYCLFPSGFFHYPIDGAIQIYFSNYCALLERWSTGRHRGKEGTLTVSNLHFPLFTYYRLLRTISFRLGVSHFPLFVRRPVSSTIPLGKFAEWFFLSHTGNIVAISVTGAWNRQFYLSAAQVSRP